jgi:hypothetical protein
MSTSNSTTRAVTANTTAAPIAPGDCGAALPEFGRVSDIQRLFGLKRGYLYTLINSGTVKSVSLRQRGAKTGVRLIHLQSVRDYLYGQLDGGK